MKQRLIFELRKLFDRRKAFLFGFLSVVFTGLFTWLGCDRLSIYWILCRHLTIAPPYYVMFVLWCCAAVLYGILICACGAFLGCGKCTLCAVLSYVLYLFWLPLCFPGGAPIFALLALTLSSVFLFCAVRVASPETLIIPLVGLLAGAWLLYCFILSFGNSVI